MSGGATWLSQNFPLLAIAAVPGVLNTLVASFDLDEKCRELPFFDPYRIPGFWLWVAIQLFLPSALFWAAFDLPNRQPIDAQLIGEAIASGIGFVGFLNAEIKIGVERIDIKAYLYEPLVKIAFWLIERNQRGKAAQFWTEVREELTLSPDLQKGLDYLEEYFTIEVEPKPDKNYDARLREAAALAGRREQVQAIMSLLKEVNRRDLVFTLQRFGCSDRLLNRYFPRQMRRLRLRGRR